MAAATTASAFTAPHVTEFLQIDVTQTMQAARRLRELPEFEGLRVSPLLLVAKALLLAVARHPMINSSWDEDSQEIVVKHYVNLSIAAATDRGLIVPNIKNAHALSLPELARELGELTRVAREGKSQPADQAGGTITITNVGVFGGDPGVRSGQGRAVGPRGGAGGARGDHARAVLRPPDRGRRARVGGAARRRRHAHRPGPDAGLELTGLGQNASSGSSISSSVVSSATSRSAASRGSTVVAKNRAVASLPV
jgi:pyruvate/2-oxoglutarate dehydrogenase complex dihydrolipoamide acyltransferase (E2) component